MMNTIILAFYLVAAWASGIAIQWAHISGRERRRNLQLTCSGIHLWFLSLIINIFHRISTLSGNTDSEAWVSLINASEIMESVGIILIAFGAAKGWRKSWLRKIGRFIPGTSAPSSSIK